MTARGWRIAERIAEEIDGTVRAVPVAVEARDEARDEDARELVVALPDGRVPILVRDFGHQLDVCVTQTKVWQLRGAAEPSKAIRQAGATARLWAESHHEDEATPLEVAVDLAAALDESLGEAWSVSFPGVADPAEAWLHGAVHGAASVGVFPGRIAMTVGTARRSVACARRADLPRARAEVVSAVREQLALYRRNAELSSRIDAIAEHLAAGLSTRLAKRCVVRGVLGASHWSGAVASIVLEKGSPRVLVQIAVDAGGSIRAHAGVVGRDGWDGALTDVAEADGALDAIVAAVTASFGKLTIDRLVPGRRYRVRETIQDLVRGSTVRFEIFDDIDNHYGRYVFTAEDGSELAVTGDFSTLSRSPLGETHRYLEELEEPEERDG